MGDYADTITAERVKRVIDGYGEGKNAVDGTGGNFSYYELGSPLFLQDGTINNDIDTAEIRKYIWYTETNGLEYAENGQEKYYLGSHNDTAYYFYYEKDKATILDYSFLATVNVKNQHILYMQILVHYQILIYRSGILHLRKYQEILSISRKDKV